MKRTFNIFIAPLLVGVAVTVVLHTVLPTVARSTYFDFISMCDIDQLAGILGFFIGFLPFFIYKMAINTLAAMKPVEQVTQCANMLHIGMAFTSTGANCRLTVKSIKRPLYADLCEDQFSYLLATSLY